MSVLEDASEKSWEHLHFFRNYSVQYGSSQYVRTLRSIETGDVDTRDNLLNVYFYYGNEVEITCFYLFLYRTVIEKQAYELSCYLMIYSDTRLESLFCIFMSTYVSYRMYKSLVFFRYFVVRYFDFVSFIQKKKRRKQESLFKVDLFFCLFYGILFHSINIYI